MADLKISICVENLSQANKGNRINSWFELPVSFDEIASKIQLDEVNEEYEITDFEAPFKISSSENIDYLNEIAELIEENSGSEAIQYLGELVSGNVFGDFMDALNHIDEIIVYSDITSFSDYAEFIVDEGGYLSGLPDFIKYNIDYDGIGRDIRADSNLVQMDDGVLVEVN
ncbi:antirestriction protein ArdA [Enterococcus faecalis]|uniref:antirestriction protein ArdA n=1 Tax=Enterococcus faecalis TaxID=1351 RepID=UPI001E45E54E|nr:antirestriction protein ArdA [Enterococcus faecalis]MCD4978459.1 antirestriction protein ArdA [Enterococcus faecalis]